MFKLRFQQHTLTILLETALVGAVLTIAAPSASERVRTSRPSTLSPGAQQMVANDLTYSVSLPPGWEQVGQATLDYGLFFGSQAESFVTGIEQVYMNANLLSSLLGGYSAILSPAQLTLKSRLLAPPLSPLQIVTRLLPQLAGGPRGAIQNLRVLRTIPGDQAYGFNQMLVRYQYTFVPQRDPAFASQAHPVLRSQPQVPMQGAAFVVTFPYMPGQFSWIFGYRILSASQTAFQRNEPAYAQIFKSFQLIPEGLALKVKLNQDWAKLAESMNQTTRKVAQDWWRELGPVAQTYDPNTGEPGPEIPGSEPCVGEYWQCGNQAPRCYPNGPPPGQDCRRLTLTPPPKR
jgi:hypothetical protein